MVEATFDFTRFEIASTNYNGINNIISCLYSYYD